MKTTSIAIFLLAIVLSSCKRASDTGYQPSGPGSTSSSSSTTSSSSSNQGLTNAKVETAVADLLSDWRMGGSVSVRGIQENSQTNSAVADLQFNNFEFGVTHLGELLRSKDFKPRKPSGSGLPHPDELFPQRKVSYSKSGRATLAKYNDGRWVLKQVNWHDGIACCGVTGNVEIR